MSDPRYEVRFRGEIAPGKDPAEVKRQFAGVFGLAASQVERLFAGREVVLKRGLEAQQARRFVAAIEGAGAVCSMQPEAVVEGAVPPPPPPPPGASGASPQPAARPAPRAPVAAAAVAEPPSAPASGQAPSSSAGEMTCPKCHLAQPAGDTCMACGVVIAKYAERNAGKQEVPALLRRLLDAYRPALASPRVLVAPEIPAEKLEMVREIYTGKMTGWPDNEKPHVLDPDEEILLLVDATMSKHDFKANLLLTTKRLLYVQHVMLYIAWGILLEEIRSADLGGLGMSSLKINGRGLDLPTFSREQEVRVNKNLFALFNDMIQVLKRGTLPENILAEAAARAPAAPLADSATAGAATSEKKPSGGVFAPEKKGIEKGIAGGVSMMLIAIIWFGIGMKMGIIFFYPPVLFLIGVYAFLKGVFTGNVSGKK